METNDISRTLDRLGQEIERAGRALLGFFNPEIGVFWRDTQGIHEKDTELHPTSTNRCFYALFQYLRYLREMGVTPTQKEAKARETLTTVVGKYYSLAETRLEQVRKSSTNDLNLFTDGQLLQTVSLLGALRKAGVPVSNIESIQTAVQPVANQVAEKLQQEGGGKVHPEDQVHHFVTLHALRGLDAFDPSGLLAGKCSSSVKERVHRDVMELLAYDYAGVRSEFDASELAFSVAVLNRIPTADARHLIQRAIRSIGTAQSDDGSWPTSRLVSQSGKRLLHVASYEVALALSYLLLRKVALGDFSDQEALERSLYKTLDLVTNRYDEGDGVEGWSNDHVRSTGLIESWATAIVLTFLIHYHDALTEIRQRLILDRYRANSLQGPGAKLPWPDMTPFLRSQDWVNPAHLSQVSDPTEHGELTVALKERIVNQIAENWIQRPKGAFLFLHGPPGTRKTSMVRRLADSLQWPMLALAPPIFLQSGLEGLEARADEIFADLGCLRRCVILLDECEEFFRKRRSDWQAGSRTVGAFITAGMLPRIQQLRELGWIVFVIATNIPVGDIDEAVVRLGRFDFLQAIDYPTLGAQRRYLAQQLPKDRAATLPSLLEALDRTVEKFRSEKTAISFSVLDEWLAQVGGSDVESPTNLSEKLIQIAERQHAPRLVRE